MKMVGSCPFMIWWVTEYRDGDSFANCIEL